MGFMMSQWVFRDARERGLPASALVGGLKSQLIGIVIEARYPEPFKTQMLDEIGEIADLVIANAKLDDDLGQPEF